MSQILFLSDKYKKKFNYVHALLEPPRLLETSSSLENMLLNDIIRVRYDFVPTLLSPVRF